jgi:hypothetical protein
MKINVHLGVHKTATTFIQSQLHDNRTQLTDAGIAFCGIWHVRKTFTSAFDVMSWIDPMARPLIRTRLGRRLARVLPDTSGVETFILSDENLLGLISANHRLGSLYPNARRRVALLDALLAGHQVHYFLSIRRYPDYLTSSWLQLASRGKAPAFENYLSRFSPAGRGWAEVVADVARACGPDRLTVWTYDWFSDDPSRAFELLAPAARFEVPQGELRRDVLPSMTIKGLKVMTALEDLLSGRELKEFSRFIRTFPFDEPNPRLEIADAGLVAAYEDKYVRDLAAIRALGVELHG